VYVAWKAFERGKCQFDTEVKKLWYFLALLVVKFFNCLTLKKGTMVIFTYTRLRSFRLAKPRLTLTVTLFFFKRNAIFGMLGTKPAYSYM